MNLRTSIASSTLFIAAFAAALAPSARAEDVTGYVTMINPDPLASPDADGPFAPIGTLVQVQRLNVSPELAFQTGTLTGINGSFQVLGLVPGYTYSIRVPGLEANRNGQCTYQLLELPPGLPPIVLPNGLDVPPGPPKNVHLKGLGCSSSSPVIVLDLDPTLAMATMFSFDEPALPLKIDAVAGHRGAGVEPPFVGIDRPVEVRLEWLNRPDRPPLIATIDPRTELDQVTFVLFHAQPTEPGDRIRISFDPNQPALDGYIVFGPTSKEMVVGTTPETWPEANFYVRPVRPIAGRVFAEIGGSNGVFDGADVPLEGVVLRVHDVLRDPPDGIEPLETTTDAQGRYAFPRLPAGYYMVEVMTGPEPRRYDFRSIVDAAPPDADFAYAPDAAPHVPCTHGGLHELTLETRVFVGDAPAFALSAELTDDDRARTLRDTLCARWTGAFPGRQVGPNGVLDVESVSIAGGIATVRVRLVADGTQFPGGFFGRAERRLVLRLNGALATAASVLDCSSAGLGATLPTWLPSRRSAPESMKVVDHWGYDDWRRVHPGICVGSSLTANGGANFVELEVEVWRKTPKGGPRTADVVFAAGRSTIDRVHVRLGGAGFSGFAHGDRGVLTVTDVFRTPDGRWRVRAQLEAPDRPDGNPGALPLCEYHLDVDLSGAKGGAWFDLRDAVVPGDHLGWAGDFLYAVRAFRNPFDTVFCR